MRQLALNVFTRPDKIHRVVVMRFNTGRNGKNIGIENDVFRRETHLLRQDLVGATADLNLPLTGIGLSHFIKCHHHHGSPVAADKPGMMDKCGFALFH